MAHGDYDCCAVCDRKMAYGGERTKEDLCSECAIALAKRGVFCGSVAELLVWIKGSDFSRPMLLEAGYSPCYYTNAVDAAVEEAKHD